MRAAPGHTVPVHAFYAGQQQGQALPQARGTWHELTTQPYQNDDPGYADPFWSDSGSGWGLSSGRISALATSGSHTVYAGGAAGGVWVSHNRGRTWSPIFDRQSNLSVGALAVDPADQAVWVGEGEANLSADEYGGDGIYRSTNGGQAWRRVGGTIFGLHTSRLVFDGNGHVYAATNRGVLRHSTSTTAGDWQTVLAPAGDTDDSYATDVQVRPGTGGQTVVATIVSGGGGSGPANGFYVSPDGGATWQHVATTGDLDTASLGRTSFVFSPDGSTVYDVAELADYAGFYGVFQVHHRRGRAVDGDRRPLDVRRHLRLRRVRRVSGLVRPVRPGGPQGPSHVYVGLEEIYETSDAGQTWTTIGPYWNFGHAVLELRPGQDTCPDTTHPDQHAACVAR